MIRGFLRNHPHLLPCLIAAVLLFVAAGRLPYWYYQLLRWAVCAVAVYSCFAVCGKGATWAVVPLIPTAILFNPIVSIHFRRETWRTLDIIAAVVLLVVAVMPLRVKIGKGAGPCES